jgi:hypothetical protein
MGGGLDVKVHVMEIYREQDIKQGDQTSLFSQGSLEFFKDNSVRQFVRDSAKLSRFIPV